MGVAQAVGVLGLLIPSVTSAANAMSSVAIVRVQCGVGMVEMTAILSSRLALPHKETMDQNLTVMNI